MSSGIYSPDSTLKFGVLGPVVIRVGSAVRPVPSKQQRTLLAMLLAKGNHIVSIDYLVHGLWDGRLPSSSTAYANIYSYIMRLRRTLGPELGSRIGTCESGYIIEVGPGELDLIEFARHSQVGKRALDSRAWGTAAAELRMALDLWRDGPYADVSAEILQRDEVALLEEQRLIAVGWRIDAELHLGHCGEVIPILRRLAAEYPLREKFAAQLMLALSAAGRRGEALAAFETVRHDLAHELGLDPGAELTGLQMQILSGHQNGLPADSRPAAQARDDTLRARVGGMPEPPAGPGRTQAAAAGKREACQGVGLRR